MKTWMNLANLVALFCLLFFINNGHKELEIYEEEYNQLRLSKATEYATDAAFYESINAKDQDLDYTQIHATNMVDAEVNASKTLETFDIVMAANYDLAFNERSYKTIEDSIGAGVLIGKDGFYRLDDTTVEDEGSELRWSPKLPYTATVYDEAGSKVATFAVTLNTQEYISIDPSGKIKRGKNYSDTGGVMTDEIRKTAISQTLTDAIALSIDKNSEYSGETDKSVYIPTTQTFNGINDITTPTLIFFIRDAGYAGVDGAQKAALTGMKTIREIRVITYYDDGVLKYCYEFQGAGDDKEIVNYYDTIEDAAKAGALPDYNYLFNGIDYDGSSEVKKWY